MIQNPILPGCFPDPSICRVGTDYYIANSTFEWVPGVTLHHSKDLKHWRQINHVLRRPSQLDLVRTSSSTGVWAPALSYNQKQDLFYVSYTVARSLNCQLFDMDNYLVTAPAIEGPWSDPIYLHSSGFDPSVFHDLDGRLWVASLIWDFREGYEHPGFICIQEYSAEKKQLVGERHDIYHSKELGCVEGPHIYRKGEYYYLMTAEGGTGYGHACVLSRSKNLLGPYEYSPYNPLFTSTDQKFNGITHLDYRKPFLFNANSPLQKSGHGSLVETQTGECYVAHLCARPFVPELRCPLGRETALQKVVWSEDGWLRLADGGNLAQLQVPQADLPEAPFGESPARDDFDGPELSLDWSSLRTLVDESWASLTQRPGYLRLRGRESMASLNEVSLVAKRVRSFHYDAETCVEFEPRNFQQMAGLACLYDNINHYFLRVYWSDSLRSKCIGIMSCENGRRSDHRESHILISGSRRVFLRVSVRGRSMAFFYSLDGSSWHAIGPVFDATKLSDEFCANGQFTGSFVGITAQDFERRQSWADFDYFQYKDCEPAPEAGFQSAEVALELPSHSVVEP